jgi:hypothetical protein
MKTNMKKSILKGVLAFAMVTMMSACTKEYHCHCIKQDGGEMEIEIKAKKSEADKACEDMGKSNAAYKECHLD